MAPALTPQHIHEAIAKFGNYRTKECQRAAHQGAPDLISGSLIIAMGLRESDLQNVNNASETDHGWLQINDRWHSRFLNSVPAVRAGTWGPVVEGHQATEDGYCPRFRDALFYAIDIISHGIEIALDYDADRTMAKRVALAGFNAGLQAALDDWRDHGNPDLRTAGGDYSSWVIAHQTKVNRWLNDHAGWKL